MIFQDAQPEAGLERYKLEEQCKSGARWFYWIAALSLLTSVIALSGGEWGFFISLGVTQVVDAMANSLSTEGGAAAKAVALVFDALAVGLFALFGFLASKKYAWAFVAGMALYLLDGVVFLLASYWLGLAFHALALYGMFSGFRACRKLNAMDAAGATAAAPAGAGAETAQT